jgi:hypothetical protein
MNKLLKPFIIALSVSTLFVGCATSSPKPSTCEYQIVEGHLPKLNETITELARDGWQIVTVTPTDKEPGGFQFVVVTLKRCK